MRAPFSLLTAVAVASLAAAVPANAQANLVPLDRVRQLYAEGQSRRAAQALGEISAEFRQEIGRCKDPEIGAKLIDFEPRIDALIARLGTGSVSTERVLTSEFAVFDQLLAENHLQLAELGWGQRRNGRLDAVGRDLDLAVRYAERSARWAGRAIDPQTRATMDAARMTAAQMIDAPAQTPPDAERHLVALAAVVRPRP